MLFQFLVILGALIILKQYFRGAVFLGIKPDLTGKIAVVTGGNAGIGRQTALDLVKQGCYVIIGARDTKKSEKVVEQIKLITKSQKITQYSLDLGDRKSIEQFVSNIKNEHIDFLVNNAGLMELPLLTLSEYGHEMQYTVNHLGHFYLTYLLMNKLKKSSFFRIINVSSRAHLRFYAFFWKTTLDFQNINFQNIPYSGQLAYCRSKLYNVLFTKALASKIPHDKGITVSLHPGTVRTDITRYMNIIVRIAKQIASPILYLTMKNSEEGAQTTLHVLYTEHDKLQNGGYYSDCKLSKMNPLVTEQNWVKLWQISERDTDINFCI